MTELDDLLAAQKRYDIVVICPATGDDYTDSGEGSSPEDAKDKFLKEYTHRCEIADGSFLRPFFPCGDVVIEVSEIVPIKGNEVGEFAKFEATLPMSDKYKKAHEKLICKACKTKELLDSYHKYKEGK